MAKFNWLALVINSAKANQAAKLLSEAATELQPARLKTQGSPRKKSWLAGRSDRLTSPSTSSPRALEGIRYKGAAFSGPRSFVYLSLTLISFINLILHSCLLLRPFPSFRGPPAALPALITAAFP
jgi:hypothetical protein